MEYIYIYLAIGFTFAIAYEMGGSAERKMMKLIVDENKQLKAGLALPVPHLKLVG